MGLAPARPRFADVSILHGRDVQPDGFVWGLDRIDQDAGAPGGVFIAAVDVDGVKPHVFAFDLM